MNEFNEERMPALLHPFSPDDYDGELSGVDWDFEHDAQEDVKPTKAKRKFKHGDYRLTPTGYTVVSFGVAFCVSLVIMLGFMTFTPFGIVGVVLFLQSIASMMSCVIFLLTSDSEQDLIIGSESLWFAIIALVFVFPTIVLFIAYSIWLFSAMVFEASVEKVGEQPSEGLKGVPEPPRTPQPSYKLMPDGHTLYGPPPKLPRRAPARVKDDRPEPIPPPEPPGWM